MPRLQEVLSERNTTRVSSTRPFGKGGGVGGGGVNYLRAFVTCDSQSRAAPFSEVLRGVEGGMMRLLQPSNGIQHGYAYSSFFSGFVCT
jgi:hypothetical protein